MTKIEGNHSDFRILVVTRMIGSHSAALYPGGHKIRCTNTHTIYIYILSKILHTLQIKNFKVLK